MIERVEPMPYAHGANGAPSSDWLRPEDGGRAIAAAAVLEELRRQREVIATLLEWLHRFERPRIPEDYGLDLAGESAAHRRLATALLPPGVAVERDALIRRAYVQHLAEGWDMESLRNILRSEIARLRLVVAERGWDIPPASSEGRYVLLAPDMPRPAGYGTAARHRGAVRRVPLERLLEAWRLLGAGVGHKQIVARAGICSNGVGDLRRGRHWSQREGLVPGWQVGVRHDG